MTSHAAPPTDDVHDHRPTDDVHRGWLDYREQVLPSDVDGRTLLLVKLGYYGGAAQVLGLLLGASPATRPALLDALATEVLDETDRLLLVAGPFLSAPAARVEDGR